MVTILERGLYWLIVFLGRLAHNHDCVWQQLDNFFKMGSVFLCFFIQNKELNVCANVMITVPNKRYGDVYN